METVHVTSAKKPAAVGAQAISNSSAKPESKTLQLEGMRGLLALVVLTHHFVLLFYPVVFYGSADLGALSRDPFAFRHLLAYSPLNVFMNGRLAVCIFLVISGYVLTLSYKRTGKLITLQASAVKRYFRLVIPVLGACLFLKQLFMTGWIEKANYPKEFAMFDFGRKLFTVEPSFLSVFDTALFATPLNGGSSFLPVLWTVQIEFLGALTLFAFLALTHQREKKIWFGLALIACCFYLSCHFAPLLIAGGLLCLYEEKIAAVFRSGWLLLLLFIGALFLGGIMRTESSVLKHTIYAFTLRWPFEAYAYFHALSAVMTGILLLTSLRAKRVLSLKPFAALGRLTFSIYLLHLPLIYCLGSYLMWSSQGKIHPLLLFAACFGVTLLISYWFYRLIDKTAIRLSQNIGNRLIS